MHRWAVGSGLCFALCGALATRADGPANLPAPPDDVVFRAMQAELARARSSLRLEGNAPPYFAAAGVSDIDDFAVMAADGALTESTSRHDRRIWVSLRVGDRNLDNSRVLRFESPYRFFRPRPEVPEADDERALRRVLWQAIDQEYKDAVEDLATKRAALDGQARSAQDELPDFSTEPPTSTVVPLPEGELRRADWEAAARRLSGIFREFGAIDAGTVSILYSRRLARYLDTDGTSALHPRTLWAFEAAAETQAGDGMPLHDFVSFYAPLAGQAPPEESMATALREMAARLTESRSAPRLEDPYSGPVVLEDQAAAEFLLALAGESAAVSRPQVSAEPRYGRSDEASPWQHKLGARVVAEFLDVLDDPTLREHHGLPLVGSYAVDDEGVPAQPVVLVERGVLRGVLATRQPVRGAPHSNGHSRFGGPAPGVLVVTAAGPAPVSPAQVRLRLLDTLRERGLDHGYVIRRIQNQTADPGSRRDSQRPSRGALVAEPIEVFQVSASDGHETRVRGVRWGDLDVRALKDVVVASSGEDGTAAFNMRARFGGGPVPTSVIAPRALLLDDLELVPASGPYPTLPVLSRPPGGPP